MQTFKQHCYIYKLYQWAGELLSSSEVLHGICCLFLVTSASINCHLRDEEQLVDLKLNVLEKIQLVKICMCQLPVVELLV